MAETQATIKLTQLVLGMVYYVRQRVIPAWYGGVPWEELGCDGQGWEQLQHALEAYLLWKVGVRGVCAAATAYFKRLRMMSFSNPMLTGVSNSSTAETLRSEITQHAQQAVSYSWRSRYLSSRMGTSKFQALLTWQHAMDTLEWRPDREPTLKKGRVPVHRASRHAAQSEEKSAPQWTEQISGLAWWAVALYWASVGKPGYGSGALRVAAACGLSWPSLEQHLFERAARAGRVTPDAATALRTPRCTDGSEPVAVRVVPPIPWKNEQELRAYVVRHLPLRNEHPK